VAGAFRGQAASRFPRYAQVTVLRLLVPAGVAAFRLVILGLSLLKRKGHKGVKIQQFF
jgi:hypothetical protein